MFFPLQEFVPSFFRPDRRLRRVLAGRPLLLPRCHILAEAAFVLGHHVFRPTRQAHKFGEHGMRRLLAGQERAGRALDRAGRGVD
jgi:hypothetical protein